MDKKMSIGIIIVAVVVVAVAALIVTGMTNDNNDSNKYVIYDGNGHLDSDGNATVKSETSTIPKISWQYSLHAVKCYNDKKDGSGTNYNEGDAAPYGKTLYAQYMDAKKVTVKLVDVPSYLTVKHDGTPVTNGQTFEDDQCTFTFTISTDAGHEITAGPSSEFYVKEGDNILGKVSIFGESYGSGLHVQTTLLGGTITVNISDIKELTIKFVPQTGE